MKTFLKWAGNKSSIIEVLKPYLIGKNLIEPFVGSCAVSLNTDFDKYICNDINEDMIVMYQSIQNDVEKYIEETKKYFINGNNSNRYYELRELYNTTSDKDIKARLFLYLNRHCFNGLCRYNKSNKFNVPFGKYVSPVLPEDDIRKFADKVKDKFNFINKDFKDVFAHADENSVVYCDPPYSPLTETADFANYSGDGFNQKDHYDLTNLAIETVKEKNCIVIISNHNTSFTKDLYKDAKQIIEFDVKRTISRDINNRKKAPELLAIYK